MFQMIGVSAELKRAIIRESVVPCAVHLHNAGCLYMFLLTYLLKRRAGA